MSVRDPHVNSRCTEIELLLNQAASWASNDPWLGANLAAYITVVISGVLEDCVEHLVALRVAKTGDNEIMNYVGKVVTDRFKNPDWSKISGMLKDFSEEYQRRFGELISHNGTEASALMSILANKNELAHVGTWKLEMTVREVGDYYRRIVPILEVLEQILT